MEFQAYTSDHLRNKDNKIQAKKGFATRRASLEARLKTLLKAYVDNNKSAAFRSGASEEFVAATWEKLGQIHAAQDAAKNMANKDKEERQRHEQTQKAAKARASQVVLSRKKGNAMPSSLMDGVEATRTSARAAPSSAASAASSPHSAPITDINTASASAASASAAAGASAASASATASVGRHSVGSEGAGEPEPKRASMSGRGGGNGAGQAMESLAIAHREAAGSLKDGLSAFSVSSVQLAQEKTKQMQLQSDQLTTLLKVQQESQQAMMERMLQMQQQQQLQMMQQMQQQMQQQQAMMMQMAQAFAERQQKH